MRRIPKIRSGVASGIHPSIVSCNRKPKVNRMMTEFSFPQLIVVPLSCHEVDGVRKEKERLTAAQRGNDQKRAVKIRNDHKNPRYFPWNSSSNWWIRALMIIEDERLAVLSRNCWNNGISRWKHRPDKRLEEEIVCNRW